MSVCVIRVCSTERSQQRVHLDLHCLVQVKYFITVSLHLYVGKLVWYHKKLSKQEKEKICSWCQSLVKSHSYFPVESTGVNLICWIVTNKTKSILGER